MSKILVTTIVACNNANLSQIRPMVTTCVIEFETDREAAIAVAAINNKHVAGPQFVTCAQTAIML